MHSIFPKHTRQQLFDKAIFECVWAPREQVATLKFDTQDLEEKRKLASWASAKQCDECSSLVYIGDFCSLCYYLKTRRSINVRIAYPTDELLFYLQDMLDEKYLLTCDLLARGMEKLVAMIPGGLLVDSLLTSPSSKDNVSLQHLFSIKFRR